MIDDTFMKNQTLSNIFHSKYQIIEYLNIEISNIKNMEEEKDMILN